MIVNQLNPFQMYEQFLVPAMYLPQAREIIRLAKPKAGENVLDVACGTGIVAREVSPLVGKVGAVTGIDFTPGMLEVARQIKQPGGPVINWMEGNAMAMAFDDETFDLVTCQQGAQFFNVRLTGFKEMKRVLVSCGRIVLAVNQGFDKNEVYRVLHESLLKHSGINALESAFSFGDGAALRSVMTGAGFSQISITPHIVHVRLPSENVFVMATILSSGTAVQAFKQIDTYTRTALFEVLLNDLRPVLALYREGDEIVFPLHVNIARGVA